MRDYYTLKEMVFGLRKEQLRIAKKLRLLESKVTVYNDKKYNSSRFDFDLVNNNVKLIYHLHEKYGLLDNLLNVMTFRFKNFFEGKDYVEELRKLESGDYKIGGLGGLKATIFSDEQASFNGIVDELLKDEFVNNALLYYTSDFKSNYDKTLLLKPTCSFCINRKDNATSLFYDAKGDNGVIFQFSPKRNLRDVVNDIMEVRFPRKLFSEYIQFIIDNSDEAKKDVIVQENGRKGINDFYINDERDAFVLVKKK